jgi:hypothetical protein
MNSELALNEELEIAAYFNAASKTWLVRFSYEIDSVSEVIEVPVSLPTTIGSKQDRSPDVIYRSDST